MFAAEYNEPTAFTLRIVTGEDSIAITDKGCEVPKNDADSPPPKVKISVRLPPMVLMHLDEACRATAMDRSQLLCSVLMGFFREPQPWFLDRCDEQAAIESESLTHVHTLLHRSQERIAQSMRLLHPHTPEAQ